MTRKIRPMRDIKAVFKKLSLDALLVTGESNIRYVSGFSAPDSSVLLLKSGHKIFITDPRNIGEAVRRVKKGVSCKCLPCIKDAGMARLIRSCGIKRLGVEEENMTLALFRIFKRLLKNNARLVPSKGMIEDLRLIKTRKEVGIIRENVSLTKKILKSVLGKIRPGVREIDITKHICLSIEKEGVRPSFEPIASSGPNTAKPHAIPSARRVKKNDLVMIDFGISRNGYSTDITRTILLGRQKKEVKKIYNEVRRIQQMAISLIRPGVLIKNLALKIREDLEKNGLKDLFLHSLGHGIGLDIHERPGLSEKNQELIKEGMVFTVEPGLYVRGRFGIRIEDMVLVTENGARVLTR